MELDLDLRETYSQVMEAELPEDVLRPPPFYVPLPVWQKTMIPDIERIRDILDPDRYALPQDAEAAAEARARFERLLEEAERRVATGFFGLPRPRRSVSLSQGKTFRIGPTTYHLEEDPPDHKGILRDGYGLLYDAVASQQTPRATSSDVASTDWSGRVSVRVAKDAGENGLLEREARVLGCLHAPGHSQSRFFPLVLDRFEASGRRGNVLRSLSGFTLTSVRAHRRYGEGIDQRDVVWMMDRLLNALGFAHAQGVVHGRLTPDRVVLDPAEHHAEVRGWGLAREGPGPTCAEPVLLEHELSFLSPEVRGAGQVGPWSDIYSLGLLVIWLLGGDPGSHEPPPTIDSEFGDILTGMVTARAARRPRDAWELKDRMRTLSRDRWGRVFRHFDMTG